MPVYVFKRNKETGRKMLLGTVHDEATARSYYRELAAKDSRYFFEFTADKEMLQ